MPGTRTGGLKTAAKLKERDEGHYSKLGKKSWETARHKPHGFAADTERAKRAGAKGGKISKRGPNKTKKTEETT